jgi:hypothetical protein
LRISHSDFHITGESVKTRISYAQTRMAAIRGIDTMEVLFIANRLFLERI